MSSPLSFEDVTVGLAFETPGITIGEHHVLGFAGLTGDFYELHVDDEYARAIGYPGRVAHGLLGLALADGLKNRAETRFRAIVSLGWRWRFAAPILIGDRVSARVEVIGKRETSKPDRGIVTIAVTLTNQRGETVQLGENDMMVWRRVSG